MLPSRKMRVFACKIPTDMRVLNRWKTKIHRKKSKMSEEIAPLKIVLVFKLYQDVLCNQLYTMDN